MEIVIEEEVEKKMRSSNKNKGPPPSSYGYANHSLRKYFPIPNRVQRLKSDSSSSSSSSSSSCGSKRKIRSMILGSFSSNNAFSYCISDGTSRRANNATSLDHRKGKILDEGKGDNNEEKEDGGLVYKSSFDNSHSSHHHHHHHDKVGLLMAIETSKTKNHHDQISQQELLDNNKKERNSIARCHLHCETSGILRSISSSPSSSLLPTCGYSNYTSQISPETVTAFIEGKFRADFSELVIIDCRYWYEYEGGHIKGALNLNQKKYIKKYFDQIHKNRQEKNGRRAIIFHCEYSQHRGPELCKYFRALDREANAHCYPYLDVEEVHVMRGGYRAFFANKEFHRYCDPVGYVSMDDEAFKDELEKQTGHRSTRYSGAKTRTHGIVGRKSAFLSTLKKKQRMVGLPLEFTNTSPPQTTTTTIATPSTTTPSSSSAASTPLIATVIEAVSDISMAKKQPCQR